MNNSVIKNKLLNLKKTELFIVSLVFFLTP